MGNVNLLVGLQCDTFGTKWHNRPLLNLKIKRISGAGLAKKIVRVSLGK